MAIMPAGLDVAVVWSPKQVKRPWRERLFSRPWRPLKAFKTVEHPLWHMMDDDKSCFQFGSTLYVSERQFYELQKLPTMKNTFSL